MASELLVSIVIPVYNRARLIGRAVSSALAQTYTNFEIVIVDDASTDGLHAALAAFDDPRLRYVAHEVNQGAAAARNTGVAMATGEYVAFLDSDDLWLPEKLAHQVRAMQGQPAEVAGHVCAYDCVRIGYPSRRIVSRWSADGFGREQLFGCYCGPGTTLLCRRDVFAAVGPFDAALRRLEDWDWMLRLAASGRRLIASPEALAWVEVGDRPSQRDVHAAVDAIRARHRPAIAGQGLVARRIFDSSLHLERAAGSFGGAAYWRAAAEVLRSIASYPFRGGGFYWRLIQRMIGETRAARAHRDAPNLSSSTRQAG